MRRKGGLRKFNIVMMILSFFAAIVGGYYVSAGTAPGATVFIWYENMEKVMEEPFLWYYNENTLKCIGIILFIAVCLWIYYFCMNKNFRFGEEQGSSKWADVKAENKLLSDPNKKKDDPENIVVKKKEHFKEKEYVVNTRERIISEHLHLSMDSHVTDLNNNVFIVGGSGAGKTHYWARPNIMNLTGSYIITDPKGELLRTSAGFLKKRGYTIKAINLLSTKAMKKSSHYNPFNYITSDDDIVKLVTMYMDATKKEGSQEGDQFWTDSAGLLLQAYFYYAYYEGVEIKGVLHHDFRAVMHLANLMKVEETPQGARKKTKIDQMFSELEEKNPEHPAVLAYNKAMVGAVDTVRSIISTLNSRLTRMQTNSILDLLSEDEIDIKKIGVRKTAVFCVIPDRDKTYNFVVSMLYAQMFQQLYDQADLVYEGKLPVPVTFLLDEFANVALPENFLSLLSTMRSRNIASVIIIQNLGQIKKMYKDDEWESIPGNCDVTVYLGGNEPSTHKWISEMTGKETVDKRSESESKGKQGSVSKSEDVMQRELMYPDEVRRMRRKKCLVFINGKDPIYDDKIKTKKHPLWKEYEKESKKYRFDARLERIAGGQISLTRTVNGKEEEVKLTIYDPVEVNLLTEEDKRNKEEYEEECFIAKKTGQEMPKKPQDHVIEMTLEELLWLEQHEPELLGKVEKELRGITGTITEEELIRSIEEMAANEGHPKYASLIDPEADFEEAMQMLTEPNVQTEQAAIAFGRLAQAGFSHEQIGLLLPLTKPEIGYTVERICAMFSPDLNRETMEAMIGMLT